MDPLTMLSVGGQVLSTLGGLFGKKKKTGLDLGKLRAEAKANGFNPLTVLRMTGGAGFESSAEPSKLGMLGEGVSSVASILSVSKDRELQTREAEARIALMGKQMKGAEATVRRAAGASIAPLTTSKPKDLSSDLLPSRYAGMKASDIPMVEVRALNGQLYQVRADVTERLGIGAGSTMLVEDFEALVGEIGAEVVGAGEIVGDVLGVGDPWMKTTRTLAKEADEKLRAVTQPFSPLRIKPSPVMRIKKPTPGWMEQKLGPMQ